MGVRPKKTRNLFGILADHRTSVEKLARTPQLGSSTSRGQLTGWATPTGAAAVVSGTYEWPFTGVAVPVITALVCFDGNGYPNSVLGQQPDGTYGLGFYNTSGTKTAFYHS